MLRRSGIALNLLRRRSFCYKAFDASELRPDEVVAALDKHIVGQSEAKVATAIALRDQWRRQQHSRK